MESITLGQLGTTIAFLAGIIAASGVIYSWLKKRLNALFAKQLEAFDMRMKALEGRIAVVDLESCKNYLVSFLSDVERGKRPDEIELERFCEQYQHYQNSGGNSYIKAKVEKLKKEGKL